MKILQKSILIILVFISIQTVAFGQKSFMFKGQIIDGTLNEPLMAAAVSIKGKPVGTATDIDGKFSFKIEEKYWKDTIVVSMLGYTSYKTSIEEARALPNHFLKTTLQETSFILDMAEIGAPIILNNIFFDFNKHELLPTSFAELEKLYNFLQKKEAVIIEIAGHTDSVGTDIYNAALSEARASSVMAYLEEKGIDQNRMTAKGYGESRPVVSNDTEKGQRMNRRVEFTVISKGEVVNTSIMPDSTRQNKPDMEEVPEIDIEGTIDLTPPTIEVEIENIPTIEIDGDKEIANQFNEIITDYSINKGFNGVVTVYKNGVVTYKNGVGFSDLETTRPNTLTTKFYIGTMSEQFTAALILKSVKTRKIDLSLPLKNYLKGLPKVIGERVTVAQLLSHTSGLCNGEVSQMADVDLCFVPNMNRNYSEINYILLGKILENIHKAKYKDIVQNELIKPLKLNNTKIISPTEKIENLATGYRKDGRRLEQVIPTSSFGRIAGDGVVTTVEDLVKWQEALKNSAWFSGDLQTLMETPMIGNQSFSGEVVQVVMGEKVLKVLLSEATMNGHKTMVIKTPSSNVVVVIASNIETTNFQPLYRDILKVLFL